MRKKVACSFDGCYHYAFARGLCRTHYWQQSVGRQLTPIRFHGKNLTPKIRFDRLWRVNAKTQCWEWEGARDHKNYGMFWWDTKVKNIYAHRASWLLYNGDIPKDQNHAYGTLGVLHVCDTPYCVNPDHLFLGTHTDNMRDASRKGRFAGPRPARQGENHCHAKVTIDIVREIRASTESQAALGRTYGISRATVGEIQRREIWKHVMDEPLKPEPLDPREWPRYIFHPTRGPKLVHTPEEEAALGPEYRRRPFTDLEMQQAALDLRGAVPVAVREPVPPSVEDAMPRSDQTKYPPVPYVMKRAYQKRAVAPKKRKRRKL